MSSAGELAGEREDAEDAKGVATATPTEHPAADLLSAGKPNSAASPAVSPRDVGALSPASPAPGVSRSPSAAGSPLASPAWLPAWLLSSSSHGVALAAAEGASAGVTAGRGAASPTAPHASASSRLSTWLFSNAAFDALSPSGHARRALVTADVEAPPLVRVAPTPETEAAAARIQRAWRSARLRDKWAVLIADSLLLGVDLTPCSAVEAAPPAAAPAAPPAAAPAAATVIRRASLSDLPRPPPLIVSFPPRDVEAAAPAAAAHPPAGAGAAGAGAAARRSRFGRIASFLSAAHRVSLNARIPATTPHSSRRLSSAATTPSHSARLSAGGGGGGGGGGGAGGAAASREVLAHRMASLRLAALDPDGAFIHPQDLQRTVLPRPKTVGGTTHFSGVVRSFAAARARAAATAASLRPARGCTLRDLPGDGVRHYVRFLSSLSVALAAACCLVTPSVVFNVLAKCVLPRSAWNESCRLVS